MRDDIDDRRDGPFFTTGFITAMLVAVFLAAALFMWAPWTGSRVADNFPPGMTTGQSTSRPAPPATTPAPAPAPTK
jgi:hypothetical protein